MNVFSQLKVIELCRVYSGPLCGMLFGDLGAEVIKIERPVTGDESRAFGLQDQAGRSSYFNSLNRNKESLFLDLKSDEGKEILIQLIKEADVLVHNWIQGSLDKLGFSYKSVQEMNDRIVYCAISGFGYNSPFKNQRSQDIIAQSMSGLLSLTGEAERSPLKTGIPVVDYVTGMNAAFAIMSALYMRTFTHKGQLVHTSLLESALSMTSFEASKYLAGGEIPKRSGNRHPAICPYNIYTCNDGLITIAVANDAMFVRFCESLGLDVLANDQRFDSNVSRLQHQDLLEVIIEERLQRDTVDHIMKLLEDAKVSCSPVNNIEEAFNCEVVKAVDMIQTLDKGTKVIGKSFHLEAIDEVYNKEAPTNK